MDRLDHCHARVEALEPQTEPLPQQTYTREAQTRGVARRRLTRLTLGLCTLLAHNMVVGGFTPAAGQAISCGATLGPGGQFLLEADLECGTLSPALTVRDGTQLDLGGHTISGGGGFSRGPILLLEGQGAVVHHGIVQSGTLSEGIHVAGEGGHTVRRVSVFAGGAGVAVASDHNRVLNNMATIRAGGPAFFVGGNQNRLTSNWAAGPQIGFSIAGDQNLLVENTYAFPSLTGFFIGGNQNLLIRNNVAEALQDGFRIAGDGNRLVGNLTFGGASEGGISVSGQDTEIVGNTALDNGIDLVDAHEDCDNNRWHENVFRTSQAGATANPACIQGAPGPQAVAEQ